MQYFIIGIYTLCTTYVPFNYFVLKNWIIENCGEVNTYLNFLI